MNKKLFSILCILVLLVGCFMPMAAAAEEATPNTGTVKPSDKDLGALIIVVDGPDPRCPITLTYSQFKKGTFELPDLVIGDYTVSEVNEETFLESLGWEFDPNNSVVVAKFTVTAGGTAEVTLVNAYDETELPPKEGTINIPVSKTWMDNNNKDGNRPSGVRVHLFADGKEVKSAVLGDGNNWYYIFRNMPEYQADKTTKINYTLTEDKVGLYEATITGGNGGFSVVNTYKPETTAVTVQKIWNDENNKAGTRPLSIYCRLNNGMVVVLSEENGWSATVTGLPTIVNGKKMHYSWTEQSILGYVQTAKDVTGSVTTFTNTPATPPPPYNPPLVPETEGVDVMINHVGDCFD